MSECDEIGEERHIVDTAEDKVSADDIQLLGSPVHRLSVKLYAA